MEALLWVIVLALFGFVFYTIWNAKKTIRIIGTVLLWIIFIFWVIAWIGIGEDEDYISELEGVAIDLSVNNMEWEDCVEASETTDQLFDCSL